VNATFASAWTIKNADGGAAVFTRSFEDTAGTNSTWGFCITPNSTNYTVSVDVTVDATNYTATTHFIVDTDYTQTTQNISLYLLHDDDSTLTKIVIRDRDSQPVKDVYTTIQKYDVGTDTYYNVAMTRSDNNGEDLVYLAWYDYWYKFIGTLDGTVVFTEGPKKISETPQTFQTDELEDLLYEKFNNIIYTLVFNNVTKNFVLTYVDPSGEVTSNCLKVLKRSLTGDLIICDNCETSNSATMYCNIATEGNGTFVAIYYARASLTNFIDFITQLVNVQAQIYDQIGSDNATGMSILIAGIVVALFLVTPAMGIIGVILGVFLAVFLGFQPLDYAALGSIVVAGLLMVWAVQK